MKSISRRVRGWDSIPGTVKVAYFDPAPLKDIGIRGNFRCHSSIALNGTHILALRLPALCLLNQRVRTSVNNNTKSVEKKQHKLCLKCKHDWPEMGQAFGVLASDSRHKSGKQHLLPRASVVDKEMMTMSCSERLLWLASEMTSSHAKFCTNHTPQNQDSNWLTQISSEERLLNQRTCVCVCNRHKWTCDEKRHTALVISQWLLLQTAQMVHSTSSIARWWQTTWLPTNSNFYPFRWLGDTDDHGK